MNIRAQQSLGAHLLAADRARFAVWAPNASAVSVVGDFNDWDAARGALTKNEQSGVWSGELGGVTSGQRYKFRIVGRDGRALPLKADPYAIASELRPANASVVADRYPPRALPHDRVRANRHDAPISIYEFHATSWRRDASGGFADWDQLAAELVPYVAALGFTHVEVMPVSEYPLDDSWGYQTLGLFAPTARHGSAAGMARFVDACQQAGLGVILDWVPAHFPADAHGLAQFDGTALYEYADPREGYHHDWHTLIYNFGRHEVRDFLASSALYWIEQFGADGLRVDAVASMLYRDYSRAAGEWIPNQHGGRENLEAIALLRDVNQMIRRETPGAVTIAEESTAFPGVTRAVDEGGLGFHFKWNMGWMNDTLSYLHEDPIHRKWHHDCITFGLGYAFSENYVLPLSHDEVVHGKGSLLDKMPGDDWQRFANLRALYGLMWAHPGKKLLFMGQEFAQRGDWSFARELPWHEARQPANAGVQRWVTDLNKLYRSRPALYERDSESGGFQWLVADDREQSVFAWARHGCDGQVMLAVINFTPVVRHHYVIGVPRPGVWHEVLNGDDSRYGGSGVANPADLNASGPACHGCAQSLSLTLPPLAALFIEPAS